MSTNKLSRPAADILYAPVCIGDLQSHNFKVSIHELTENVAKYLQEHPEVPGVMLTDSEELVGMIPRYEMFERMGRRYGVELFLRKPIIRLMEDLQVNIYTLPSNLRVETAIQQALNRKPEMIYDPIVVLFEDGHFNLLDMQTLLLVQSQIMENLNGVMHNLGQLEDLLKREPTDLALKKILDALRFVVPFHHISILLLGFENNPFLKFLNGLVHFPGETLERNPIYKSIFEHQQTICLDDVQLSPAWQGVNGSGKARSWMGIPLVDREGFLGILSLSRYVVLPFSHNERDMSSAFAWYLSQAISEMIRPHMPKDFPLKDVEIKRERFQQPALQAVNKQTNLTL